MSKLKAPCIQCLSQLGFGCVIIAKKINASPSSVRRILSPEYAERCREAVRSWTRRNPDRARQVSEDWRKRNLPHRRDAIRAWRKKNPQKANEYEKTQLLKPQRRIAQSIRRRIRETVSGKSKSASTLSLLGCSFGELKAHLERQFQSGMSWGNYGPRGWHIDHRRPLNSFDLSDPMQQREAFHFGNLQPMWAILNIQKHAKWPQN